MDNKIATHKSDFVQQKIQELLDELCQYERSTSITSILIIRQMDGFCLRAVNGIPKSAPDDMTDEELLKIFRLE